MNDTEEKQQWEHLIRVSKSNENAAWWNVVLNVAIVAELLVLCLR